MFHLKKWKRHHMIFSVAINPMCLTWIFHVLKCMWNEKFLINLIWKYNKCFFVGYLKKTKWYYFYNPSEDKIFVAQTVVFLER